MTPYSEELVKNKTMNDYRAHTAIDFKAAKGTKVISINDGLVLSVTKDAMLGTVIEIDHGSKALSLAIAVWIRLMCPRGLCNYRRSPRHSRNNSV